MEWLILLALLAALAFVVRQGARVVWALLAPARARGAALELDDRARQIEGSEPGGSRDDPVEIDSPSVVEAHARNRPCTRCEGVVDVLDHSIEFAGDERLRVALTRCRSCGGERRLYYRLRTRVLN